jgi:hypothetical protein
LAMVGQDVMQPARVSPKTEKTRLLPDFPRPSLSLLTPSLF